MKTTPVNKVEFFRMISSRDEFDSILERLPTTALYELMLIILDITSPGGARKTVFSGDREMAIIGPTPASSKLAMT